ncbi:MAG: 2-keto-4-pentenoate hydratase [Propionibacteriaceae bacterium]|jgi:2-keto-4-pentenoate hydratase|nr:2-keto-4-pentenoate hydratase [Propionibacteriaceae bacterium]
MVRTPEGGNLTRLEGIAGALSGAYSSKQPVRPPIETDPSLTIDDAYAIQLLQVDAWLAGGAVVKGYKVGLTSKAMQNQLGVDQPDFGHLTAAMFHLDHTPIDTAQFLQPKVEPEIAFVLGRELAGPGVNVAEAIRAVDFVLPSLELIDSRVADWKIGIVDTISDNASSGGVILGSKPTRLADVDLTKVGCNLVIDSQIVATGAGSAVLGSPLNALVWLANTLGARGISFKPGDVILPGSVTAAQVVRAGSVAQASFANLGSVTAVFA